MKDKTNYIRCPNCGAEYMAAEIYLPDSFLGKPSFIDKEHNTGKIKDFFGPDMDLREKYICDYCNAKFRIDTSVKFFTKELSEEDFNKEHVTKYKKSKLFFAE